MLKELFRYRDGNVAVGDEDTITETQAKGILARLETLTIGDTTYKVLSHEIKPCEDTTGLSIAFATIDAPELEREEQEEQARMQRITSQILGTFSISIHASEEQDERRNDLHRLSAYLNMPENMIDHACRMIGCSPGTIYREFQEKNFSSSLTLTNFGSILGFRI